MQRFVDTAFGGAHNRNNPVRLEDLQGLTFNKSDCYATYFNYPEDFKEYVDKNKTCKGYVGELSAEFLPFDVDDESNLEKSRYHATKIVECLQMRYGLLNSDIDVYFSGAKGFHIQVLAEVFGGFKPDKNLAYIFKKLALEISAGFEIDPVIYDMVRLWRLPNTVNSKSGLYKIQLSVEELFKLSIDEMKDLAKSPRTIQQLSPAQNQDLTDLYWAVKMSPEKEKPKEFIKVFPPNEKYCIYNILNNGVPQGERNNAILRMAIYFNSKFNPQIVKGILKQWNIDCNIGIDNDEVERTVESSLTGYDYGCSDGLLKKYCSEKCNYFLKKKSQYTVKTIEDLEREYQEYIRDVDSVRIDLSKWLPKFGKISRGITAGEVVIVIAGSGIGKTAFLQNLLWNIPLPAVFFSYELPEILTFERFYQIANHCTGEVVERHYQQNTIQSNELKHTFRDLSLIFDTSVSVDEIPSIITNIEQQRQNKIKIVAIDYLAFVKGGQGSRYERVSYVAERLKDIAKKTNAVVICLAQVSRQEGARGDVELDITSGKDSGSIENTGDLVLGMYRPNKNQASKEDNLIRIKILKNRKGKDNVAIDCIFSKDTLQISEMYYGNP